MPIYEYHCEICNSSKEVIQKYDDPPPLCNNNHDLVEMKKDLSTKTTWIFKNGKDWG